MQMDGNDVFRRRVGDSVTRAWLPSGLPSPASASPPSMQIGNRDDGTYREHLRKVRPCRKERASTSPE